MSQHKLFTPPTKPADLSEKPADQSDSYRSQRRKRACEEEAFSNNKDRSIRYFQTIDHVYSEKMANLNLSNYNLMLQCKEAGGLGDISQTLHCAKLIREKRPKVQQLVLLKLETTNPDRLRANFPEFIPIDLEVNEAKMAITTNEKEFKEIAANRQFPTLFFKNETAYPVYGQLEKELDFLLSQPAGVLGISKTIGGPAFAKPGLQHHRVLDEYGFTFIQDYASDKKNFNLLSMGFRVDEEGISLPAIQPRQLNEIQTPWIKEALRDNPAIYFMHIRDFEMQLAMLYSVANLQKTESKSIMIVMHLNHTIDNLIKWGMLDIDFLKEQGIGAIHVCTDSGKQEIPIGGEGQSKILRIVHGDIPKFEMEAIQQHTNLFFGCAGDMSFSEAIMLNKIPLFDAPVWKAEFFKSLVSVVREQKLEVMETFFNAIGNFTQKTLDNYEKYKAQYREKYAIARKSFWEWNTDMHDAASIPRQVFSTSRKDIENFVKQLVELIRNDKLAEEAAAFNQHVIRHYNVESRLLMLVDRAIMLNNFPELIEVEKNLLEKFNNKEITLSEAEESLSNAIDLASANTISQRPSF